MQKNNLFDKSKEKKERRQDIQQLKELNKYDKILEKYGQKEYIKAIPSKVMTKDIQELFEQGRYEDIYRKYGKDTYNSYLIKMRKIDVQTETGNKLKGIIEQIKYWFKIKFAPILLSVGLLSTPTVPVMASISSRNLQRQNSIEYNKEIEEYNEHIKAYAEEIKALNLTDRQVFVKLMYDLWKDIDGYKTPENYDVLGFHRLSVYKENIGECRNFSDDLVAKLNAINPEYNARNLVVRLSPTKDQQYINIERTILENDNTVKNPFEDISRKSYSYSSRLTRKKYYINFRSN